MKIIFVSFVLFASLVSSTVASTKKLSIDVALSNLIIEIICGM